MQKSVRPLKGRRCKHLSHGDIDIRHAVLEDRLPGRILRCLQPDRQIGPVLPASQHTDTTGRIQHIDDARLHIAVGHIIQCIDVDNGMEDLIKGGIRFPALIALCDLRDGEGDDGKAPLPPDHGAVIEKVRLLSEAGDLLLLGF